MKRILDWLLSFEWIPNALAAQNARLWHQNYIGQRTITDLKLTVKEIETRVEWAVAHELRTRASGMDAVRRLQEQLNQTQSRIYHCENCAALRKLLAEAQRNQGNYEWRQMPARLNPVSAPGETTSTGVSGNTSASAPTPPA